MTHLPNFFELDLDNFNHNLKDMLNNYRQRIKNICQQESFSWSNTMQELEDMDDELNQFWSPVSHLHSVVNNSKLRDVYKDLRTTHNFIQIQFQSYSLYHSFSVWFLEMFCVSLIYYQFYIYLIMLGSL